SSTCGQGSWRRRLTATWWPTSGGRRRSPRTSKRRSSGSTCSSVTRDNAPLLGRVSSAVRHLAVLSLHTSPLAQPGAGDGGGMNVYVRELSSSLVRAGVECDVYTRAWRRGLPPTLEAEPGLRVHHVRAGPLEVVSREDMPAVVAPFITGVLE